MHSSKNSTIASKIKGKIPVLVGKVRQISSKDPSKFKILKYYDRTRT